MLVFIAVGLVLAFVLPLVLAVTVVALGATEIGGPAVAKVAAAAAVSTVGAPADGTQTTDEEGGAELTPLDDDDDCND